MRAGVHVIPSASVSPGHRRRHRNTAIADFGRSMKSPYWPTGVRQSRAPLRHLVAGMKPQMISAVARLGIGQPDVIPLWLGESDRITPNFIQEAAIKAMVAGKTFYVHSRGVPELRAEIRHYTNELYNLDLELERFTVTGSAMTAIMIALECVMDAGDNVVMPTPIWPNIFFAVEVLGGQSRFVPLDADDQGWRLDLDRLLGSCDGRTRALMLPSPGNPTGWVMPQEQQARVLEFCRERGIWIIADEVYHRIVFDGMRAAAPSFLDIAAPDDPLLVINSFSKSWAMTGWRLGWITAPAALGDTLGQLSGLNNTGATSFVQHAGVAALRDGGAFVQEMVDYCRRGRDIAYQRLCKIDRVSLPPIGAGLFAFFRVDGMDDSLAFAKHLLRTYRVGLAPGSAFGPGNDQYLRLCFAVEQDRLSEALDRLAAALT
jgi:aspartate aminotransferase